VYSHPVNKPKKNPIENPNAAILIHRGMLAGKARFSLSRVYVIIRKIEVTKDRKENTERMTVVKNRNAFLFRLVSF
jgi:hypothetical protein